MPATTSIAPTTTVTVHPLVLLSVTDHYNRVAKNTKKRVVGVLLGQSKGKSVNVANSFAGTVAFRDRSVTTIVDCAVA
jgi:26S proteasome regulatory subunit N8